MQDYALTLPRSYVNIENEEMEYVFGGGKFEDWAWGIVGDLVSNALWAIGGWAIGSGKAIAAIKACGAALAAVKAGIVSAAAWVWNTPVALSILAGVVGVGVGATITYFALK